MFDTQMALSLHEKASLGQALSPEEQTLLDAWYALQDEAEQAPIRHGRPPASPSGVLAYRWEFVVREIQNR